ncbi:MAG: DMT family transporter, partial [Desulfobacteraceae bacterium]|nr:DMT family transporter [Desulfobacteraceae bacterium]
MSAIIPYVILAIVAGFCLPTQAGINSRLNIWTQSPVLAAAISFAVGTAALIVYALILRIPLPSISGVKHYPWWIWSGGFLGAFLVAATVVLAPRLGAASMIALIVSGQMLASVVLDHYGLIGYTVHPLNMWRACGVLLLVGGV